MTILERRREKYFRQKAQAAMKEQPHPKAFPTEGPRSMQFVAYDPDRFDVCADADCSCRRSGNNVRGFGSTEQEAIADYWEQWEERQ